MDLVEARRLARILGDSRVLNCLTRTTPEVFDKAILEIKEFDSVRLNEFSGSTREDWLTLKISSTNGEFLKPSVGQMRLALDIAMKHLVKAIDLVRTQNQVVQAVCPHCGQPINITLGKV